MTPSVSEQHVPNNFNRRKLLGCLAATALPLSTLRAASQAEDGASSDSFTDWGWPAKYNQVSDASIKWLDSKGWLPLTVGHFADLPGYASAYAAIRELKLLEKRGLPAKFIGFLSGPPILEAFIGGQTQATGYGDLPFWTTVARGNPAIAYGMTAVNYEAAMLVRPDSPLQSIGDIKGSKQPVIIGTLLGSFLEFYISAAAAVNGLVANKDYRLAGMTLREAQFLPAGVDAVVSYDPFVTTSLARGIGRKIDNAFPYYFNKGYDFVRGEIHDNAPDVVQALSDAMLEATLFTRLRPEEGAGFYYDDPRVSSSYSRELFSSQVQKYCTLYKPTFRYIHQEFWAAQDAVLIQSQFEKRRMPRKLSKEEIANHLQPKYMTESLGTAGFAVPSSPVFLPADWSGKPGEPPYPAYFNFATLPAQQAFPSKGDLIRAWSFGGKKYPLG